MVESRRVPGEGRIRVTRIRVTIEKLYGRLSKKGRISVSTRNLKNPGEHRVRVESVPLLKNYTNDYQKRVESVRVPEIGRIRASTGSR